MEEWDILKKIFNEILCFIKMDIKKIHQQKNI